MLTRVNFWAQILGKMLADLTFQIFRTDVDRSPLFGRKHVGQCWPGSTSFTWTLILHDYFSKRCWPDQLFFTSKTKVGRCWPGSTFSLKSHWGCWQLKKLEVSPPPQRPFFSIFCGKLYFELLWAFFGESSRIFFRQNHRKVRTSVYNAISDFLTHRGANFFSGDFGKSSK